MVLIKKESVRWGLKGKMAKRKSVRKRKNEKFRITPKLVVKVVLLIVVLVGVLIVRDFQGGEDVNPSISIIPPMDNVLLFGDNYKSDYASHNVNFTGLVGHNEDRTDYIYASAGTVDFKLKAVSGKEARLDITVINLQDLCRKMEVYADGSYLGSIYYKGNYTSFPLVSSFTYTPVYNTTFIHIEAVGNPYNRDDECPTGHDLQKVMLIQ